MGWWSSWRWIGRWAASAISRLLQRDSCEFRHVIIWILTNPATKTRDTNLKIALSRWQVDIGRDFTLDCMQSPRLNCNPNFRQVIEMTSAFRSVFVVVFVTLVFLAVAVPPAPSAEFELNGHRFTLPDGMTIEQVAGPPLIDRPICADFDEQGRLYVAESSGSNENINIQIEKNPHRIVRLEDTDGDGIFDQRVVFADQLSFPEGTLWHNGSLYVGAPPKIWKLTDTDDDGQADQREIWLDETVTGCANDIHGPYLGPDGWIYWCKGAFAEQTHDQLSGDPLVTRAAHIFRRRPEGGLIESVMTGGMDNPVELIFTPGGERIFTTTFLVHPSHGQRDGIIHAIYGGVYGKDHGVLEGHPRTGPLMPILAHHGGASAPCGLARLETKQLGDKYQHNVLACSFNMRKIIRHELTQESATFATTDTDFLVSDNLDFHPTDIMEDADGSLLVINTGGWYKLCCPTSQLHKPDILGAIYRVRRTGSHEVINPRGTQLDWSTISTAQLIELLSDQRFSLRNRARQLIGQRGGPAIAGLEAVLRESNEAHHRREAVWALTQIEDEGARAAVRIALDDDDEDVRQVALHSISVHRDTEAKERLVSMLGSESAHNRRAAAEALGRLGWSQAGYHSLAAADNCQDRVLQHSLIYAAIETGDPEATVRNLRQTSPGIQAAALIALDQMGESVQPDDVFTNVVRLVKSADPILTDTAWWVANRHPEFGDDLSAYFREEFAKPLDDDQQRQLVGRMVRFTKSEQIQALMSERLSDDSVTTTVRISIMEAMQGSGLMTVPPLWTAPLLAQLTTEDPDLLAVAVTAVYKLSDAKPDSAFVEQLNDIAADTGLPDQVRLQALVAVPGGQRIIDAAALQFLGDSLSVDQPVGIRSLAVDVLHSTPLDSAAMQTVAPAIASTGPMALRRLVELFAGTSDTQVGMQLVEALDRCPAATSLPLDKLKEQLSTFGEAVVTRAATLLGRIEQENADKIAKLEAVIKLVDQGDVRRGQLVFHSSQAACIHCHGMGYVGGRIGPDLTRIGNVRSDRDLLESILFPSASFVRSYEPTQVITVDGQVYSGVIHNETGAEIELQLDAEKMVRIPLDEIDERAPGKVSIMPEGLDKHFSPQHLADLIVFLKAGK